MARALVEQINFLRVFQGVGWALGSLAAVIMASAVAFQIEPRDEIGHQKLAVVSSWPSGGLPAFKAEAILPNGNTYTYAIHGKYLDADGTLCAYIEIGRWFDAYHIEIITPDHCRGLRPPKVTAQHKPGG